MRRGDDQAALSKADGGDEIDDASLDYFRRGFQNDPLVRMQRGKRVEGFAGLGFVGIAMVDGFHAEQREVAFVLFRRTNLTGNRHPGA